SSSTTSTRTFSRLRAAAYRRHIENRIRADNTPVALTGSMSQTAPVQARTRYRRHRGILVLLAALACLAGCTTGKLETSTSGTAAPPGPATAAAETVPPQAGTATPSQEQRSAVAWPADGTSAADISGIGVVDGPGATRQCPSPGGQGQG